MQKINWENGTVTKDAYVTIDGTDYDVVPEEYEGNTPLSAENLNLMQDNIEDAINDLKNQKVLWQGGMYMNEEQNLNLSESVSEQNNGIVLVWSWYDRTTQTPRDFNFNVIFIPKMHVQLTSNYYTCQCLTSSSGELAFKTLFIRDTQISGASKNNQKIVKDNVSFYNYHYVLRYVIGV